MHSGKCSFRPTGRRLVRREARSTWVEGPMEPYPVLGSLQRTILLSHIAWECNSCEDVILGACGWSWKPRMEGRGSRLVGAQARGTG